MNRSMIKLGLVAFSLLIASILCPFSSMQAVAFTQGEYVVALAEKLGLGVGLTAEEAAITLHGVGISPEADWHLKHDVTCDLVAEVQILTIKAAQRGFIRCAPEEIHPLITSLSDGLDLCLPPSVEIHPMTPAAIAPEVEVKESRSATGGGAETANPSE